MEIRLTKKEAQALKKLAKSLNLSEEELVKLAIKKFMETQNLLLGVA